jgi:sugar lactone lactonase YvrE
LDIVAKDDVLYVAENSRYRVLRCDRQGKILSKWGNRDRKNIEGFGSCCNPMNLCFGPEGELYTAESGLGRIKRYTPDGKFLGLVGYVGVERFNRRGRLAASCSNITIALSKDTSRIYILDFKKNIIRVLTQTDTGFARKSDP